jgi:ribosome biogenesis GTPase
MGIDIASLGWDAGFAAAYTPHDRPDQYPARVAWVDRGICTVLAAAGTARASLGGSLLVLAGRDPIELPCTGDWVAVREWPDERYTIEAVLPRRTQVLPARAGDPSFGRALAANLDAAAVVEPMHPAPDVDRVRWLLDLASGSGARPVVVLTKAERVPEPEPVVARIARAAPGVSVLAVSARTGQGLSDLAPLVAHGHTLGLLGPAGAGKSTLITALAGTTMLAALPSRRLSRPGRRVAVHGAVREALVPLPGGGAVLDTPGVLAATRGVPDDGDPTGLDRPAG